MIKIEHLETHGWEAAFRGMRNPKNSWAKSDSYTGCKYGECYTTCHEADYRECRGESAEFIVGPADHDLAMRLAKGGSVHAKYRRMLVVTCDITAPTFWWTEFDTYKVGTVRNSCSKMHKIHVKPFKLDDFTHEGCQEVEYALDALHSVIETCERLRKDFNRTQDKKYWRALIELLPEGFNLKATVQFDYENLTAMCSPDQRRFHKLDEWPYFCNYMHDNLPYPEMFWGE